MNDNLRELLSDMRACTITNAAGIQLWADRLESITAQPANDRYSEGYSDGAAAARCAQPAAAVKPVAEIVVTNDSVDLCWIEAAVKRAWRLAPGRFPLYAHPPEAGASGGGEVDDAMVERAVAGYNASVVEEWGGEHALYEFGAGHTAMRAALTAALRGAKP